MKWKFLLVVASLSLNGCDQFCLFGICFTDKLEVKERIYDVENAEFIIGGEVDGYEVSHSFKLEKKIVLNDLSFGIFEAETFAKYGVLKKIEVLKPQALQTYRNEYLIPAKDCPVWFMNKNLEALVLIGATDGVAEQLEDYDIPFDGRGTEFKLTGHYLDHLEHRYIENDEHIDLTIPEHISIASNMGSATRKVNYFLVTDIVY